MRLGSQLSAVLTRVPGRVAGEVPGQRRLPVTMTPHGVYGKPITRIQLEQERTGGLLRKLQEPVSKLLYLLGDGTGPTQWHTDPGGLRGAKLQGANLQGEDLSHFRLNQARLDGADLRDARLYGAHLQEASLIAVKMDRARLQNARLDGAQLGIRGGQRHAEGEFEAAPRLGDLSLAKSWEGATVVNRHPVWRKTEQGLVKSGEIKETTVTLTDDKLQRITAQRWKTLNKPSHR